MLTTFACPTIDCDVFPFDNVADLEAHIASNDHTNSDTRAFIPTISARLENRSENFTPGPKPSRSSEISSGSGPTEKQLAFLAKLLAEREIEFDFTALKTKRDASALIDALLKTPKAVKATAPKPTATEVPEGMHLFGGDVFKVQRSGGGHLYAKRRDGKSWEYMGKGPLRNLSADTVVTLELAKQYGLETGRCCMCSRELTNPDSIAAGIGPICASRF